MLISIAIVSFVLRVFISDWTEKTAPVLLIMFVWCVPIIIAYCLTESVVLWIGLTLMFFATYIYTWGLSMPEYYRPAASRACGCFLPLLCLLLTVAGLSTIIIKLVMT